MAVVPKYDIQIKQGDNWDSGTITWTKAGVAVDLTALTGTAQVRETVSGTTILASITVEKIVAASGQFKLTLTPAQTSAFVTKGRTLDQATDFVYDVQWASADGSYVETILQGTLSVYPEVTR